jgi:hypothetical protein
MKVLLVVVDAATPHVVCPAIRTGRLPTLHHLLQAGTMHESSVSIFPSITPAATTSIITGAYPAEHGIAGASWFDEQRQEVAYYGDDFWIIAREGFGDFIRDFLLRLNGDRLRAPTLFEMVERNGRSAACLNYLVYRGMHPHHVRIPGMLAALPGVPLSETVEGPSLLCLGDFVGSPVVHGHKLREKAGLLHRFGMDDASTGSMLRDLFEAGLPDFTIAYFADNDYRSHEVGPFNALYVLERIDEMLATAFDAGGGIDRVLEDTCIVLTSDHGHCDVLADETRAAIRLDQLLAGFRQARLGGAWRGKDEIMICPNMRAAQVYVRQPTPDVIQAVARDALSDARVDQVICRAHRTMPGADGYIVMSRRGQMHITRGTHASDGAKLDGFGRAWTCNGETDALDVHVDGDSFVFGDYPNAFERIGGVLDLDQSGEVWITAAPGCEFQVPGNKAHIGGASHGALHALDSHSPVLVAGGPVRSRLPLQLRCVDIAPLCMQLLGLQMRYSPGDPRG